MQQNITQRGLPPVVVPYGQPAYRKPRVEILPDAPLGGMRALKETLRGSTYKCVDRDDLLVDFDEETLQVALDLEWLTVRSSHGPVTIYTINFSKLG